MEEHYTLEELSKRFNISLTVMKTCFKNIYGDSIFSYMKTYKMNQAAVLLKMKKELSVSDIAGIVGYDSPGKFSTAFKSVMGMTPLVYRNNFV
nr:AraC family transcriptional regulator [Clostridium mobile]